MTELCVKSPIPVALDEELISITDTEPRAALLDKIKPPFIILKPSLLGGFAVTEDWIKLAETRNIGWWITSALESNVGLNAIAQFTAQYQTEIPQGLGTGQLYSNNINSPLEVKRGLISYNNAKPFELGTLIA